MNRKYIVILLVLIVAAMLSVSGCSGSNTGSTSTPTPTPQAGGNTVGTPTAPQAGAPTSTPKPAAVEPSSVGQLYNINDLHSYKYRMTSVVKGQTSTGTFDISFTDTTYNGVEARRTYLNFDVPATGETGAGQMLVDVYTRKSDNSTLGGHVKWVANGQTIIDMDIPAGEASSYTKNDLASSGQASDSTPLTRVGTETVTIDGKSYSCTKYNYVEEGITYTVWYTPQAPMPVKLQWTDKDGNMYTIELISWS